MLLQYYLWGAELEMRAAEEPMRSDPDGAGAQCPGPLAHREAGVEGVHEAEEILSELVPAKEKRGYETVGRRQ